MQIEVYRTRAKQWQDAADALPPGDKRDGYAGLAQGYSDLVDRLLRRQVRPAPTTVD